MAKRKTSAIPETGSSPAPFLTDFDKYLFNQGTHERVYEKLGAHLIEVDGVKGVHFAVWAPGARAVYLMGTFNDWHGESHLMHSSDSGIWTLFVPDLTEYTVYKYRVVAQSGQSYDKADPYGFAMEQRPRTGSVVANLDSYQWGDSEWVNHRAEHQVLKPMAIYEVHLALGAKYPMSIGGRATSYREMPPN
jgi:1,4-alpha-glucan branching enzyme